MRPMAVGVLEDEANGWSRLKLLHSLRENKPHLDAKTDCDSRSCYVYMGLAREISTSNRSPSNSASA